MSTGNGDASARESACSAMGCSLPAMCEMLEPRVLLDGFPTIVEQIAPHDTLATAQDLTANMAELYAGEGSFGVHVEGTVEPGETDWYRIEFADQAVSVLEAAPLPPTTMTIPPLPTTELVPYLRSEMDRCDRYHTRLGLVGFRMTPPTGPAPEVDKVVTALAGKLRTSDRAGAMDDGTILVMVPEDIQSLPRLQKRVTRILQDVTGQEDLQVTTAARVYPGGADTPEALIHGVIQAMS